LAPASRLTPFQRAFLDAFFRRSDGFFLTGGGALVGFHLGHRETHDLDLFAVSPLLETGVSIVREVADELHATCEATQTAPDFRRVLVSRDAESLVVDLVFDRAPQAHPDKLWFGHVRVDPAEEVFANKLCALLGRAEIRDLVDVRALERAGLSLGEALRAGALKDGGLTAGQLAWVLSQITIGQDAAVPGELTPAELSAYLDDLIARLAALARP
jgi:hypothetical protein